jgi:hypothetical protein
MRPFSKNNGLVILAATEISDIAATSAVCATARICLVCVHGFTFYG